MSSFQGRDNKLDRYLAENQHSESKSLFCEYTQKLGIILEIKVF